MRKRPEEESDIAFPDFDCSNSASEVVALVSENGEGDLWFNSPRAVWRMCGADYVGERGETKVLHVTEAMTAKSLQAEMEHWMRFDCILRRALNFNPNAKNPRPKPAILETL